MERKVVEIRVDEGCVLLFVEIVVGVLALGPTVEHAHLGLDSTLSSLGLSHVLSTGRSKQRL